MDVLVCIPRVRVCVGEWGGQDGTSVLATEQWEVQLKLKRAW